MLSLVLVLLKYLISVCKLGHRFREDKWLFVKFLSFFQIRGGRIWPQTSPPSHFQLSTVVNALWLMEWLKKLLHNEIGTTTYWENRVIDFYWIPTV